MTTTGPDASHRMRFCTSCGHPAGEARFCTACGHPVGGTTPAQRAPEPASPTVVRPVTAWHLAPQQVPSQEPAPEPAPALPGWTTAPAAEPDLLDGWPEVPADEDAEPGAPRSRRGTVLLVAACVFALLALAGAAALFVLRTTGGPAREALEASAADVTAVVRTFAAARDLDAVVTAAGAAGPAADRVEQLVSRLGSADGELERAAVDQLTAEVGLLEALAALSSVGGEPLKEWGAQQGPLEDAVSAESRARTALRRVDDGAAAGRPDTQAMLAGVRSAVGGALAEDAAGRGGELLTALAAATTTVELRAAADAANAERPAVQSVLPRLSVDAGKPVLEAYDALLVALGRLSRLDGERPEVWTGTRGELSSAFGRLGAATPAAAELGTRTPQVLASLDALVDRAAATLAEFRAAYDAAVVTRDADTAALAAYRGEVALQVEQYDVLRSDGQGFFDRVRAGGVDEYDAYQTLSASADARRAVRSALTSLRVPSGMGAAHDRLVAVVSRSIGAMDAATTGLNASTCFGDCPFTASHPAYAAFQTANEGISEEYGAAVTAWGAAAEAARTAVTTRALPERPVV